MRNFVAIACVSVFLVGCATTNPDMIETASGTYTYDAYGATRDDAKIRARRAANYQCRNFDKKAVLLDELTRYQGKLDEDINDIARTAQDIAWMMGEFGASRAAGSASSNRDYVTTIEFYCD